jgi:hypothetical protein
MVVGRSVIEAVGGDGDTDGIVVVGDADGTRVTCVDGSDVGFAVEVSVIGTTVDAMGANGEVVGVAVVGAEVAGRLVGEEVEDVSAVDETLGKVLGAIDEGLNVGPGAGANVF